MRPLILVLLAMTISASEPPPPARPRLLIDAAGVTALRERLAEPALAAAMVRLRSAGAQVQSAPDAALEQSVRQLKDGIDAVAQALEQVS